MDRLAERIERLEQRVEEIEESRGIIRRTPPVATSRPINTTLTPWHPMQMIPTTRNGLYVQEAIFTNCQGTHWSPHVCVHCAQVFARTPIHMLTTDTMNPPTNALTFYTHFK